MDNLVIGNLKFVLFVDYTALEPVPNKLLAKYIKDQSTTDNLLLYPTDGFVPLTKSFAMQFPPIDDTLLIDANIILQPISKLLQIYKPSALFHLIKDLKKNSKIKQIFGWLSAKNVSDKFIIPYMEHMADTIITLQNVDNLSVITKKASGTVIKKFYRYEIKNYSILVSEIRSDQKQQQQQQKDTDIDPESLATFKINLDEEELIARNALKLPYERTSDSNEDCKIIYQPDADDDFDEEDPDEDLYI